MSLATDVAVGAAERLERTTGPGPGLALWRRLASNADSAELRGRAVLGGLRCAIAVRDPGALRDLSSLWATVDAVSEEVWDQLFATCKAMVRAGLADAAIALAHAEVRRSVTARGLYAYARCLDVSGDARAAAVFRDAIERGEKEGAAALVHASRVRRADWLSRSVETRSEAIDEAKRVAATDASPDERLVLARVLLRAPSRFVRASALGLLDAIVTGAQGGAEEEARVTRALSLAARHADDMNDELTPLEVDRLLALFSREPRTVALSPVRDAIRATFRLARAKETGSESELEAGLDEAARLVPSLADLHRRAREILEGRFEAWGSGASPAHPEWSAVLDVVVGLRDSAWPRVAHALGQLAESAERGASLPPQGWTVVTAALGAEDAEVRAAAGRAAAAMMKSTSAPPPRGWLGLARALEVCGLAELATTARRSAASAKEPMAAEALGLSLTRSGWKLALAGERSQAIVRLREARALARSHRPPPAGQGAPGPAAPAAPPPRPDPDASRSR